MPTGNLAQRAARWSARHRRVAILGWLALVLVSVFLASSVGLQNIKDEDAGNGESRQADQALAAAGFKDRASEQVLVQSENGRLRVWTRASRPRSATSWAACGRCPPSSTCSRRWPRPTRGSSRATGGRPW